jgi:hypothetical protein
MSNLDPRAQLLEGQTAAFLQALDAQGCPPIYKLTPADARNVLLGAQTSGNVIKEPADLENRSISGSPTGTISLRIVHPQGSRSSSLPRSARRSNYCANWREWEYDHNVCSSSHATHLH